MLTNKNFSAQKIQTKKKVKSNISERRNDIPPSAGAASFNFTDAPVTPKLLQGRTALRRKE